MAKKFPQDEFDYVTNIGGHHRLPAKKTDGLVGWAVSLLAVAAISGAGIFTLNVVSNSAQVGTSVDVPVTQVATETFNGDGLGVMVIDSTLEKGLAGKVAHELLDAGWNVYGAANSGLAVKTNSVKKTTVFYSNESSKAAATDLLKALGNYAIAQSSTYGDPITVILASDYK